MTIVVSKKGQHLVFIQKTFQNGLEVAGSIKIGVLEIQDPSKAETVLANARQQTWELEEPTEVGGLCAVKMVSQPAAAAPKRGKK